MIIAFFILIAFVVIVYIFMQQAQFGKEPTGERLQRILRSPNYKNGSFQNQNYTPALTGNVTYVGVMKDFFFGKSKRSKPANELPSKKTDLFSLSPTDDVLVWFGHSSYYLQLAGKKILVDPVFSGHASPVSFTTRSFKGANTYTVDDIPDIDFLFISHDHYDHLDHKTVVQLKQKVGKVVTGLGVGAHLERWGYDPKIIIEKDWNEEIVLAENFIVNTTPARHFSGRRFTRNGSLWLSFVVATPNNKIFIGGDSGYDEHFKSIGETYGPFDLAILENGQYNEHWRHIHMMPEEVVQAAEDLRAKRLLPVHWSKFSLSLHAWDEPIIRVTNKAKEKGLPVLHPMIGEAIDLKNTPGSTEWWRGLI